MLLIYFKERAAGDDRWFDRQDITDRTPGEWLGDTIEKRGVLSDVILVSATTISAAEAERIGRVARVALNDRRKIETQPAQGGPS